MSYTLLRTQILRGPCAIVYNAQDASGDQYLFSQGDVKLELGHQTFDIVNSSFGIVDKRSQQRTAKVSFTPVGQIPSSTQVGLLWPYFNATYNFQPGDSAFKNATGGDPYVAVVAKSGECYKFYGAIITKMPEIMLSADKTQLGGIEFTCVGKQGADWSTAASLFDTTGYTYASVLTSANFTVSSIKTGAYLGFYSPSVPFGSSSGGYFSANSGFTISSAVQLQPVQTDEFGLYDWTIGDISASCSCAPLDVSPSQILSAMPMQGAGAGRGASLSLGLNLTVSPSPQGASGTGLLQVQLNNANVFNTGFDYNTSAQRIPQLQFTTVRTYSSGGLALPAVITIN